MLITHIQNLIHESEGVHVAKEIAKGFIAGMNPLNKVRALSLSVTNPYHFVNAMAASDADKTNHHLTKLLHNNTNLIKHIHSKDVSDTIEKRNKIELHNLHNPNDKMVLPNLSPDQLTRTKYRGIGVLASTGAYGTAGYQGYQHLKNQ